MYTDTRVTSTVEDTSGKYGINLVNCSTGKFLYAQSSYSLPATTNNGFLNKSITSVRGPKPQGRRLKPNPCIIQSTQIKRKTDTKKQNIVRGKYQGTYGGIPHCYEHYQSLNYLLRTIMLDGTGIFNKLSLPVTTVDDRPRALQKAMAKANKSTSALMVTLGEMTETLGQIRNPLASLRKLFVKIARKSSRKVPLDDVAKDTWLEYRYGIMPMIFDAKSISEALASKVFRIFRLQGSVRRHTAVNTEYKWYTVGDFAYLCKLEWSTLVKTTCGLYIQPIDSSRFGLRFRNLLPAALELVPYSFVANWFVDLDAWLNAVIASCYVTPKYGYFSVRKSHQVRITVVDSYLRITPPKYFDSEPFEIIIEKARMDRTTDLGYDYSTVYLQNAYTTSWRRMTDSVALLWRKPSTVIQKLKWR